MHRPSQRLPRILSSFSSLRWTGTESTPLDDDYPFGGLSGWTETDYPEAVCGDDCFEAPSGGLAPRQPVPPFEKVGGRSVRPDQGWHELGIDLTDLLLYRGRRWRVLPVVAVNHRVHPGHRPSRDGPVQLEKVPADLHLCEGVGGVPDLQRSRRSQKASRLLGEREAQAPVALDGTVPISRRHQRGDMQHETGPGGGCRPDQRYETGCCPLRASEHLVIGMTELVGQRPIQVEPMGGLGRRLERTSVDLNENHGTDRIGVSTHQVEGVSVGCRAA